MFSIPLILLIAALVCFILVAANFPSRINLLGLGLALWVLAVIVQRAPFNL